MSYRTLANVEFGADDPHPGTLTTGVWGCIQQSASGSSSLDCDAIIGSKAQGTGFCSEPANANTSYCACVNAPVSNPECVFLPCADYPQAYKTVEMQKTLKDAARNCPSTINCATVRTMGGEKNVSGGVSMPLNCNSPYYWIIENLTPIVLFLILVTIISVLIGYYYVPKQRAARRGSPAKAAPPPATVAT